MATAPDIQPGARVRLGHIGGAYDVLTLSRDQTLAFVRAAYSTRQPTYTVYPVADLVRIDQPNVVTTVTPEPEPEPEPEKET
jgi:hypothetical protein